jgi:hypothetical protein
MLRMRRVILAGATTVAFLAAATVAGVAAGGGFGQAPGTYTFNDTSAFVVTFNPNDQSNLNVNVDHGRFLFRPRAGGALQTQEMTILSLVIFGPPDASGNSFPIAQGCFILQPSQFVVSSDLQSTSINVSLQPSDSCFSPLIPVLGSVPIKAAGGGGGGNFGFSYPLAISVTWTGTGAVSTSTDQGRASCETFNAITHTTSRNARSASIALSIPQFPGYPTDNAFGNVSVTTQVQQVTGSGIISPNC